MVRKLAGGTAGQLAGSEPCDKGSLGLLSDPMAEQASKVLMRMPTLRSFGEGRTCGEVIDTRTHAIRRGSGYGTSEGWFAVTGGDPSRTRERPQHRIRRWSRRESDGAVGALMPGNAGGAKGPDFWCAFEDGEVKVIGDEPDNA